MNAHLVGKKNSSGHYFLKYVLSTNMILRLWIVFCNITHLIWIEIKNSRKQKWESNDFISHQYLSSVQFNCSVISDFLRPDRLQHTRPPCPSPIPGVHTDSWPLSRWCHLIICCPLLLMPLTFPSIRVFSNKSALRIRWPKYWSFSFKISPSNEHSGLISFRMDWK